MNHLSRTFITSLVTSLALVFSTSISATIYQIHYLAEEFEPEFLNNLGLIVGSKNNEEKLNAWLYEPASKQLTEIVIPGEDEGIEISGLNDRGNLLLETENGTFFGNPTLGFGQILENDDAITVSSLNNHDQFCFAANSYNPAISKFEKKFFLWESETKTTAREITFDLPSTLSGFSLYPEQLNDKGQILFTVISDDLRQGLALYENHAIKHSFFPQKEEGVIYMTLSLNNQGDVVGGLYKSDKEEDLEEFLEDYGSEEDNDSPLAELIDLSNEIVSTVWTADGQQIAVDEMCGQTGVLFFDISDARICVGFKKTETADQQVDLTAILWDQKVGLIDLNQCVMGLNEGSKMIVAGAINEKGQIVVLGLDKDQHPFTALLIPEEN